MIRAAWLHANDLDAWWGYTHALARVAAERYFGSALQTRSWTDLGEGERWLTAAIEAARSSDVVFVCDAAVEPLLPAVAARFPAVAFVHCQGRRPTENVSVYRAARDQHAFVSGMLAGAATRAGVIAAVEGVPSPHDRRFTGAWVLGARAVRPDVRVVVGGNLTENPATVSAALRAGSWVSGHDPRMAADAGILDCAFLDWAPFVIDVIARLTEGRPLVRDRCLGASDGVVRNSPAAAALPSWVRDAARRMSERIAAGGLDIWSGPLRDNTGRERVVPAMRPVTESASIDPPVSAQEAYLDSPAFDWFPEGVVELPRRRRA